MPSRQVILLKVSADSKEPTPIGSPAQIEAVLSRYNTARDGSKPSLGMVTLHGPGMIIELVETQDEVMQLMATMREEPIAWAVLTKICRGEKWQMMDPETGRTFGGG